MIKTVLLYKMSHSSHNEKQIKVELELSSYATKSNLKGGKGINAPKFAKNFDLANLKPDVDKLDIDELNAVPVDLSKLIKKTLYDEMVEKIIGI